VVIVGVVGFVDMLGHGLLPAAAWVRRVIGAIVAVCGAESIPPAVTGGWR